MCITPIAMKVTRNLFSAEIAIKVGHIQETCASASKITMVFVPGKRWNVER